MSDLSPISKELRARLGAAGCAAVKAAWAGAGPTNAERGQAALAKARELLPDAAGSIVLAQRTARRNGGAGPWRISLRGRGRPTVPADQRRVWLGVSVAPGTVELIDRMAEAAGQSRGQVVDEAVKKHSA